MREANLYPVFLDLAGRRVLIVGGGQVGARKAQGLVESGAVVTVVSTRYSGEMEEIEGVERIEGAYSTEHMMMRWWWLVFAATDDRVVNEQVAKDATAGGMFCCRCDEQEGGSFVGGAVERVGGITLALSTGGASPVVGKRIREQVVGAIDPVLVKLVELVGEWRVRVKNAVEDKEVRGALLKRMGGEEMETCLRGQGAEAAAELFEGWLAEARTARGAGRE